MFGFVLEVWHAHSDKGAVISSLLLFATQRLDLCLEVGGPWLTGKYKLRQKHTGQQWWLELNAVERESS